MKIELRYFASIREALGPSEVFESAEPLTLGGLRDALIARGGLHAQALARGRPLRAAIDHMMQADESTPLSDGVEVAFFPPVTGG